jgi:vesicle transport through interaction with t-SNAREs protein 1
LNDASQRLAESHKLALETEEIGANTLGILRNQRQQLQHANETVFPFTQK